MSGSRISEDITITGDLTCDGPVEVWGRIKGDVVAYRLEIMRGGRVEGDVEAEELVVRGEHAGTATCTSLEVSAGAVLLSTISARSLSCERGARISGAMEIIGEDPHPAGGDTGSQSSQ